MHSREELLDELENVLGIGAYPINWPLGNGEEFRGVYDRTTRALHLFERTEHGAKRAPVTVADVHDERIRALVDEGTYRDSTDGLELLEGAGQSFDPAAMLRGDVTPVFKALYAAGVDGVFSDFPGLAASARA